MCLFRLDLRALPVKLICTRFQNTQSMSEPAVCRMLHSVAADAIRKPYAGICPIEKMFMQHIQAASASLTARLVCEVLNPEHFVNKEFNHALFNHHRRPGLRPVRCHRRCRGQRRRSPRQQRAPQQEVKINPGPRQHRGLGLHHLKGLGLRQHLPEPSSRALRRFVRGLIGR